MLGLFLINYGTTLIVVVTKSLQLPNFFFYITVGGQGFGIN